jgi:hypothetical protein
VQAQPGAPVRNIWQHLRDPFPPEKVARRTEMVADRIEFRRIRLAMWENLPAEMQARVVRPR